MSYRMPEYFVCPECGNEELQIVTETNVETSGKNFSAGKGCLGFLLFGPLGALCGLCGNGKTVNSTTSTCFMCKKCGAKFQNPRELEKEANKSTKLLIRSGVISTTVIGLPISILLFSLLPDESKWLGPVAFGVFVLTTIGCIIINKASIEEARTRYDEMARKMNYFIDKKKLENENKDENNV